MYSIPVLKKGNFIFILIIFIGLSLLMTLPLAYNITTFSGSGDSFLGMWYLWWVPYSIFELNQNPYYTDYAYYPSYSDLSTAAGILPIQGILLYPITLMNPILSYNIFLLAGFALSGVTAYFLALKFTKNTFASFIAGFIFAFGSVHMIHAPGHFHLQYIAWIPLFILFLFELKENPKLKSAILFSIPLILTVYTADVQIVAFLMIFLFFFLVYFGIRKRNEIFNKKFISYLLIGFVISLIFVLPATYPILESVRDGNFSDRKPAPIEPILYSMDVFSFFTPAWNNYFIGPYFAENYSKFTGNASESTGYIGFSIIGLSLLALWKYRKQVHFWFFSSLFLLMFTMGPVLHIMGRIQFLHESITPNGYIPLPGAIFYFIPVFDQIRAFSRLEFIALMTIAILAAFGIKFILDSKLSSPKKILIMSIIFILIFIELFAYPFPLDYENFPIPEFYYDIKDDQGVILSLPGKIPNSVTASMFQFYAGVSEKPLIGGKVSRERPSIGNTPYAIPVSYQIEMMTDSNLSKHLLFNYGNQNETLCSLNTLDTGSVVLHKKELGAKTNLIDNHLQNIGLTKSFEDHRIIGYKVPSTLSCVTGFLGNDWLGMEKVDDSHLGSWLSNDAELIIISPESKTVSLNFKARNIVDDNSIEIYKNDNRIFSSSILQQYEFVNVSVNDLHLEKGINTFVVSSSKSCVIPALVPEINNGDSRCLSIFIYDYEIIE